MIPPNIRQRFPSLGVLLLCITFIFCGIAAIPYPGIQTDEAIFTSVLFDEPNSWFWISVFHKKIPLMVMSYLGTAKSALYSLIFMAWPPSVWSLRLPALLIGALGLALFYLFLRRALGLRPALFATALLSFDTSYLLTSVFDWGPVAIQHACLLGALTLLVRYFQTGCSRAFCGGFFLLGLGMWDKAIFAWMLSGAAVAFIVVFPQILMREIRFKQISLALFFFALGALPLIIYNVRRPLETFRGNASFSFREVPAKYAVFQATAVGSGMMGYVVFEDWAVAAPRAPRPGAEAAIAALARLTGYRREHLLWPALAVSLAACPFLLFTRWRRAVAFCLICFAVAWAQMLMTDGAGGGVHHVILLWPLPVMLVAIAMEALAERCGRWGTRLTAAIGTLMCFAGLAVTANFHRMLIQNGSPSAWTDAIFPLSGRLMERKPPLVLLADWGMMDNLRSLAQGRLKLRWVGDAATNPAPPDPALKDLALLAAQPGTVFVSNTGDRQMFEGVNDNLRKAADRIGYERLVLETVADSMGRPCFEIFRLVPKPVPVSIGLPQSGVERAPRPASRVGRVPLEQPVVK